MIHRILFGSGKENEVIKSKFHTQNFFLTPQIPGRSSSHSDTLAKEDGILDRIPSSIFQSRMVNIDIDTVRGKAHRLPFLSPMLEAQRISILVREIVWRINHNVSIRGD